MAEIASESWWIKLGVMYDKSGFKAAIGGMLDLRRMATNLADAFRRVVDANSDLYNTARYLNVSTGQLQTWERAFRLIGGSADEARGAISNLNFVYDQLRLGMGGEKAEIGARLHLNQDDFLTFETMMEALNRSFNTFFQGDYGAFKTLAEQLGLSEHAMLLVTQSTEDFHRTLQRAGSIPLIPEHQLKAARELQEQFVKLSITWDNFKARVVSSSFPALNKIFKDLERVMNDPKTQESLVKFFETLEKGFNDLANDEGISKLIDNLSTISSSAVKVLGWGAQGISATVQGAKNTGSALGNVVGTFETKGVRGVADMFGLDLMVSGIQRAIGDKFSNGPVTQYITINGVKDANGVKNAVVDASKQITNQQQIETIERTRQY